MITRLHIENFKSLEDFHLPSEPGATLAPLTVLVGLNGSGKSTMLQALDFIGQLVSGKVNAWLAAREWQPSDLQTAWKRNKQTILISVTWLDKDHGSVEWEARYNLQQEKCTYELVRLPEIGKKLMIFEGQVLKIANSNFELKTAISGATILFEGSVLSVLTLADVHPALASLKNGLLGLKSLELLSPHLMRKRAKSANDIGSGGEKLSAFLSSLNSDDLSGLSRQLRAFYPHLESLTVKSLKAGWKNLVLKEDYSPSSEFGASHVNDGLLRVVGILAQAYAKHSVVLFDEIENGVNQQIVGQLMDFLLELSRERQVLITTHSPLILNFLPDEKAREGVIFLYKNKRGATQARRFFDLPRVAWKVEGLGPGEAFVDTDLTALSAELANEEGGEA